MFIATDFVVDVSLTFHKPYSISEELRGCSATMARGTPSLRRKLTDRALRPSTVPMIRCIIGKATRPRMLTLRSWARVGPALMRDGKRRHA